MWQSLYDYIEMVERNEKLLEELVMQNERNKRSIEQVDEENEIDDESEIELANESAMNRTFTKIEIENNDPFEEMIGSLSMSSTDLNDDLAESNCLTPIPKAANRNKGRRSSFIPTDGYLPMIDELSILP